MSEFQGSELKAAREANRIRNDEHIQTMKKKSPAFFDFFNATEEAKRMAERDGIAGAFDQFGGDVFTTEQGIKAACHGREDTAAILMIQLKVLQRLDRNRNYMWAIIAILLYIASQLG